MLSILEEINLGLQSAKAEWDRNRRGQTGLGLHLLLEQPIRRLANLIEQPFSYPFGINRTSEQPYSNESRHLPEKAGTTSPRVVVQFTATTEPASTDASSRDSRDQPSAVPITNASKKRKLAEEPDAPEREKLYRASHRPKRRRPNEWDPSKMQH